MLSEQFDKKVKEAADRHHPSYDEKAWEKMEKLLDKHLPQEEKDRRRFFFILFLFLLLGGGAWVFFGQGRKDNREKLVHTQPVPATGAHASDENDINNNNTVTIKTGPAENNNTDHQDKTSGHENNRDESPDKSIVPTHTVPVDDHVKTPADLPVSKRPIAHVKTRQKQPFVDAKPEQAAAGSKKSPVEKTAIPITANNDGRIKDTRPAVNPDQPAKDIAVVTGTGIPPVKTTETGKQADIVPGNIKPVDTDKRDEAVVAKNADKAKDIKLGSKKSNAFFLTLSTGPDASMAGSGSPGKLKWVAGVGAGFTYKQKFTLRAGFYNARKIYTATPDQYHAPKAFYSYYPNLENVEADCRVYEIPVSLSYNFGKTSRQHWFASAGLSSYLMKRETYKFYYKYTTTSPTVSRTRTIRNSNDHYFSVLNLSGGFQRNLNKSVSLTVEPYVKIPLSGVGFGKVHLNSGGILLSIGVNPFSIGKKK